MAESTDSMVPVRSDHAATRAGAQAMHIREDSASALRSLASVAIPGTTGAASVCELPVVREKEYSAHAEPEIQVGSSRMHSSAKRNMTQPRVACAGPYRLHVLHRSESGEVPECSCGRQHMIFGDKYRYCTCGLSKQQVSPGRGIALLRSSSMISS